MPRLLSSKTKFGNELSEIKLIRRVLLEFGVSDENDTEIDRVITLVKVDETQDKMMLNQKAKSPVKGPMDKYVIRK